nr:AraC family transcriptional regulator [uncultured Psychroserpens sp.]
MTSIDVGNIIIIGSIFIGLLFGLLLLLSNRINKKANQFLGIATLIIVCWNVWMLNMDLGIYLQYPKSQFFPLTFSLALGPSIYFYVLKITKPDHKLSLKDKLHFVPVVLDIILYYEMVYEALEYNILLYSTWTFVNILPIVQFIAIGSVIIYCIKSLRVIRFFHKWLTNNYSNDDKYKLYSLYRLLILFTFLWFLWLPFNFIDFYFYNYSLERSDYYPLYILMATITIWIAAEAYLKPEIILLEKEQNKTKREPSEEKINQSNWLKNQMEANLFYLNSELTLRRLAEELEMHPNTLSNIINEGLDKSFSDFINEYRIKAVINRLEDSDYANITLLGIAYDCGFNSKTTFNRVFKKTTGKTPLQYKKLVKQ